MLNLFTIPPEKPFLKVLSAHIFSTHANEQDLSRLIVLLSTRRACRSLKEHLMACGGGKALLLPRIQPIGEVDADTVFAVDGMEALDAKLPPAIPRLRRHLLLTQLVSKFSFRPGMAESPYSMVQAARLALELAQLFDQVEREHLDFAELAQLVPEDFAVHWQLTLRFLTIITREWPNILKEERQEDPIRRRNLLIEGVAAQWSKHPPPYPVIAAGSTGSQPATAALLSVIARMPQGTVILPAFDTGVLQEVWEAIDETHPQFTLKRLLARMEASRESVRVLDSDAVEATCNAERLCLFHEALKPADLTSAWRNCEIVPDKSLEGVTRIESFTLQEEAKVISVMLREAVETPGKTAAVVTQDRVLARMIAACLERYGITIDDSAGKPLNETPKGIFLRLVADAAQGRAAPVPLLSLLKSPYCRAGMDEDIYRVGVDVLERYQLRGPRPQPGLQSLLTSVEGLPQEVRLLLEAVNYATQGFFQCFERKSVSFSEMLQAHLAAAEMLVHNACELWEGEDGEALALYFHDLLEGAESLGMIDPFAYPGLLDTMLSGEMFRPASGQHPRLHIYSPQEARLERADLMIIAGLNEGVWPPSPAGSPWMSRPMQRRFGLPLPEQAVGKAAHDLLMIAGAKELVLSRAEKADGSPTIPSRWLLRLDTLLQALSTEGEFRWPRAPYFAWLARLEMPELQPPFLPPAPRPPVAARPRKLSVTAIETWQRDPYAIYAGYVLNLRPLDALDAEPDAASFGSLIHKALEEFTLKYSGPLPPEPLKALLEEGRQVFAPLADHPAVSGYWWPRFVAIASWVVEEESVRRSHVLHVEAERLGMLELENFTLTARIDRMEVAQDGLTLIDYKTGTLPSNTDVASGLSPQLPLEALIVERGRVQPPLATKLPVVGLEYWKLAGEAALNTILTLGSGKSPPITALMLQAEAGLISLIAAYNQPDTPYLACPDPARKPRYNNYEHLERLAEWSAA